MNENYYSYLHYAKFSASYLTILLPLTSSHTFEVIWKKIT